MASKQGTGRRQGTGVSTYRRMGGRRRPTLEVSDKRNGLRRVKSVCDRQQKSPLPESNRRPEANKSIFSMEIHYKPTLCQLS